VPKPCYRIPSFCLHPDNTSLYYHTRLTATEPYYLNCLVNTIKFVCWTQMLSGRTVFSELIAFFKFFFFKIYNFLTNKWQPLETGWISLQKQLTFIRYSKSDVQLEDSAITSTKSCWPGTFWNSYSFICDQHCYQIQLMSPQQCHMSLIPDATVTCNHTNFTCLVAAIHWILLSDPHICEDAIWFSSY